MCGLCFKRVLGVCRAYGSPKHGGCGYRYNLAGVVDASVRRREPQDSLKTGALRGGYTGTLLTSLCGPCSVVYYSVLQCEMAIVELVLETGLGLLVEEG